MSYKNMQNYKDAIIKTLSNQIAIRSEKAEAIDDKPFGEGPYEALEAFLKEAEAMGMRVGRVDNYAGYVEIGPEDKEMVAAVCHLDVVPAQGWADAYEPKIEDDKIIGRGSMDDKGPAVAVLYAMKSLLDDEVELPNRIRLILGCDEESGSECMRYYVKNAELPLAAFTADADFPVIHGEKGHCVFHLDYDGPAPEWKGKDIFVSADNGTRANVIPGEAVFVYEKENGEQYEIETVGKMGHASMPQFAKNAIQMALADAYEKNPEDTFLQEASRIIGTEYDGSGLGIKCFDDKSGELTSNVGIFHYNKGQAKVTIDVRYPVSYNFKDLKDRVEKTIAGSNFTLASSHNVDPLFIPESDPLVKTLMESYQKVTGRDDKPMVIGGGTYARTVPNTLAFGPCFPEDENLCHQKGEYITIDTLVTAAEVYREALFALAKTYAEKSQVL